MNRRSFLGAILAAAAAPAIVRADSLMRIVPRGAPIFLYTYEWQEYSIEICSPSVVEIVAETFRQHSAQIKANILANNALLARHLR